MVLTWTPAGDEEVFDNPTTATYKSQRGAASSPDGKGYVADYNQYSITNCLRHAVTSREAQRSEGLLQEGDTLWSVPLSQLPSTLVPTINDLIVDDDDVSYRVISWSKATMNTRWKFVTRR